jgi:hypothetical protein
MKLTACEGQDEPALRLKRLIGAGVSAIAVVTVAITLALIVIDKRQAKDDGPGGLTLSIGGLSRRQPTSGESSVFDGSRPRRLAVVDWRCAKTVARRGSG